jgi:pimeloyl-ACP methyl ester carboxylesterase
VIPPPAPGDFVREGVLLRVLPRSGHMVQAEAADEVNRLIGDFLGG